MPKELNPGGAQPDAGAPPSPDADPEASLTLGAEPEASPTPGELEPAQEPGTQPSDPSLEPQDARVIPGYIRELKDKAPEAYKRAKTDFFDLRDRRTVHPTVQAAREEHEFVKSLGGREGVASLQEDGRFFKDAANQFLRGDKAFYADLWEEDQTAAETGLPIMLEIAREKSPEFYEATTGRIWDATLQRAGFNDRLNDLAALIQEGKKDEALKLVNAFYDWRMDFKTKAQKTEDPRLKRMMADRASEQQNRGKAEKQQFVESYQAEAYNAVVADATKVFDGFFKNRKLEEDDRRDLLRETLSFANKAVVADENFKKQRDGHLERGDAQAALKLTRSRYAQAMPDAVKRVARRYGVLAGPAKPAAPNQQGKGPSGAAPPPDKGFTAVNERPRAYEIDHEATAMLAGKSGETRETMIVSGRAVLKDGRKVSWAHLKQKVA
jgi:hypothetical protein